MLIGFVCISRPLTMLFAILPFLGSLIEAGAFMVAVTLAVPITLLTIALAWIVHRPLIGGGLLAAAVVAYAAVAAIVTMCRCPPDCDIRRPRSSHMLDCSFVIGVDRTGIGGFGPLIVSGAWILRVGL